ncbi:hypothetical protein HNR00_004404 [Methylorubrum rhodinum]|jgi:hypothetical protein|uniref:Uncharacterized protein n=1 Tax=Methylorubrum rhodinum TaxID=29428 RepID=A0A840ZQP9_9HYPH|nr:hypothetical protein [Methylorubrum rhodinum]MBB5759670.1 hypothetical protein [Methylorubrum rhodinum]
MRNTLLAAAALTLAGLTGAGAQTTVIERDAPDRVVVDRPATTSSTTVERRESTTTGCSSKTVTKENDMGDRKTVTKETCD